MDLRCLWRSLVRIAFSLLGGGVLYFLWMAAFLWAARLDSPAVETVLWLLAPVVTAVGFAAGVATLERLDGTRTGFLRILTWPLVGCALGAGVVYWFGPMLIVFGMLAAGTASVALREVLGFSAASAVLPGRAGGVAAGDGSQTMDGHGSHLNTGGS